MTNRFETFTVHNGWALQDGKLRDPDSGEQLKGERLEKLLTSYELFNTLKVSYSVLKDPRDKALAQSVIAMWRAQGYE